MTKNEIQQAMMRYVSQTADTEMLRKLLLAALADKELADNLYTYNLIEGNDEFDKVKYEVLSGTKPEELAAAYARKTAQNDHIGAALLLAQSFGSAQEVSRLKSIQRTQEVLGYLPYQAGLESADIARKYYHHIKKASTNQ